MSYLGLIGFDNCATIADARNLDHILFDDRSNCAIASGRFGGNALEFGYTSSFLRQYVTPLSTAVVGFATMGDWNRASFFFILLDTDQSSQVSFSMGPGGVIQARQGNSVGNIVGSAQIPNWNATTFFYIEIACKFDGSVGTIQLWCEGVELINVTNVRTNNSNAGNASAAYAAWYCDATGGVTIDDIYLADSVGDITGPRRVQTLLPVASSGSPQWTPLSGTNLSQIDSITPDGDATYNASATPGQTDLYTFGPLAANTTGVTVVQPVILSRKDDAADRTIASVVVSSGTTATGAPQALTSSYRAIGVGQSLSTDPATSASWTVAAVNALVAGYTEVS